MSVFPSRARAAIRPAAALGVLAAIVLPALSAQDALAADPRLFFLKDIPSDELSGAVEVREAVEARVEVPVPCEAGWGQCFETRRFRHVFALEFRRERKRSAGDAVAVDAEPLGTIHVATSFDEKAAIRFRDELRSLLEGLDAYAFNRVMAGVSEKTPPLDVGTLGEWIDEPSWLCLERAGGRRRSFFYELIVRGGEGDEVVRSVGSTGFEADAINDTVCDGLQEASASATSRTFRTFASPLSKRLQTVFVEEADDLPEAAATEDLAPLPEGAWIIRTPMPGVVSGGSAPRAGGGAVRAEVYRRDEKLTAQAIETDLTVQALVAPGLVRRWTVANTFFTLGKNPSISNPSSQSFLTAYFPAGEIVEIAEDDLAPERLPAALGEAMAAPRPRMVTVSVDFDAADETTGDSLMRQSLVTLESLERAVIEGHAALSADAGLVVLCREDASATYYVAPVMIPARLRNAGAVCPVLYSRMR